MKLGVLAVVTVLSVLDGDTVRIRVDQCRPTFLCGMSIRVLDLDTPESRRPPAKCAAEIRKGLAAKAYAKTLLIPGQSTVARFDHVDKYGGRWDGDISLGPDLWLRDAMLAAGHGRPYDGGKKGSWCSDP
jgi:endonuclease YncB( thermonuclease family)